MLSNGFSIDLHLGSFDHRATKRPGGNIVYRLADRSGHVVLPEPDWERLCDGFRQAVKPFGRTANRLYFCFPFALFGLGITLSQMPERFMMVLGIPFVLFFFFGPLGIYLWHSGKVKGLARAMETELRRYPRAPAPPLQRRLVARWVQIAVLILVGPEIVFQLFGTLFPHAYDRSPWQGLHLDLFAIAGVLLLAVHMTLRWRTSRLARAAAAREAPPAPVERTARRRDVVARARAE